MNIEVTMVLPEPRGDNRYYIEGTADGGDRVSLHLTVAPEHPVPKAGDILELPKGKD